MNSGERSIWSMLCWPRAKRLKAVNGARRRSPMHPSLRPKLILLPVIAFVLAAGLSACGSSGSKVASADVAVVGTTHILQSDFDALITQAKVSLKQQNQT